MGVDDNANVFCWGLCLLESDSLDAWDWGGWFGRNGVCLGDVEDAARTLLLR